MNFNSSNDFPATAHTYPQLPLGVTATFEMVIPVDWTLVAYDPTVPAVLSTPHMISMSRAPTRRAEEPQGSSHMKGGFHSVTFTHVRRFF